MTRRPTSTSSRRRRGRARDAASLERGALPRAEGLGRASTRSRRRGSPASTGSATARRRGSPPTRSSPATGSPGRSTPTTRRCRSRSSASGAWSSGRRSVLSVKVVVCVKQVGSLGDEVEFTDDERDVDPDYLDYALNEWDSYATEEALRLREAAGDGEVVGRHGRRRGLRGRHAAGARHGRRPRHPRVVGRPGAAPTRSPSRARSPRSCGRRAPTSSSAACSRATRCRRRPVPRSPRCSTCPRVAVVTKLELGNGTATAHRELEGGLVDVVEVDTPAVLTIQTGINEPRYATLRAIKQAGAEGDRGARAGRPGDARGPRASDVRAAEGRGRRDPERRPRRRSPAGSRRSSRSGCRREAGLLIHAPSVGAPRPTTRCEPIEQLRTGGRADRAESVTRCDG